MLADLIAIQGLEEKDGLLDGQEHVTFACHI